MDEGQIAERRAAGVGGSRDVESGVSDVLILHVLKNGEIIQRDACVDVGGVVVLVRFRHD